MEDDRSCYFCGCKIPVKAEYLILFGQTMCSGCENRLVRVTVTDDCYLTFKEKIKRLWFP